MNPLKSGNKESLSVSPEIIYLRLLWHRRWIILFCVLIFAGLGAFQTKRTTPVYTSEATIKFEPSTTSIVDFGERSTLLYQRDEIRTAVQMIRSPKVAIRVLARNSPGQKERAIQQGGVKESSPLQDLKDGAKDILKNVRQFIVSYKTPELDEKKLQEQNSIQSLLASVIVLQQVDTKLITIRVRANDPSLAKRTADAFCEEFIGVMNEEKLDSVAYIRDYITKQIEDTKVKLTQAEQELYNYSMKGEDEVRASDIRILNESRDLAITTMGALTAEVENQKNAVALLEAELNAIGASEDSRLVTFKSDPAVAALISRRTELLIDKQKLEAENKPGFQPMTRLDQEIAGIDKLLGDMEKSFDQSKSGALKIAQEKLKSLETRLQEQQAAVNKIEEKMIHFRVLQREVDATRDVFTTLVDQFKRMEVNDEVKPSNVTVVSEGSLNAVPTEPNVTRTLWMFSLVGLLFGAALVLALNFLDRSVKNPEVIERNLGLPSLGFIPMLKTARRGGILQGLKQRRVTLLTAQGKTPEAEAFRYLRTSLQYSSADRPPQAILVTSCFPQEGKSTVAANLALSFAERGTKTLLVDADLKRPMAHRIFEISKQPGVSDVLATQTDLDQAVVATQIENLHVLPAGFTTPSPITLLESKAMVDLIARLRTQYGVIVIDSAPLHGMADSLVLSTRVDGVLLVVRQGKTLTEVLSRTTDKLRMIGANIFGVVYNDTRPGHGGDGYYGDYYAKGYGYNYASNPEEPSDDENKKLGKDAASDEKSRS